MSIEGAIEYAFRPEDTLAAAAATRDRAENPDPLIRREREVTHLIGQGLTNRRIAKRLGITERIVETHVGKA